MSLDIFTDQNFTIPSEPSAPACPICDGSLTVDVYERDETGLPTVPGFHVWCSAQGDFWTKPTHRDWDYDELLTVMGAVRSWLEAEADRRRRWEICLWGESSIPALAE